MKTGFENSTLDVRTTDGLYDTLLEPLVFLRLNGDVVRAPAGGTTDGLSVPRCLQSIIPATGGDWFAAVLHDSAYRDQLQITVGSDLWKDAHYSQKQSDDLILEAMKAQGVGLVMRQTIYRSLRVFGHLAFAEDRRKTYEA